MVTMLARIPQGGAAASLTPSQWSALRFLARANRFSRTVSAVAAFQATTRGTASQLIKGLEAKGLLRRTADARDRRTARLDLTEAGLAQPQHDPFVHLVEAASTLAVDERDVLADLLRRLAVAVVQRRQQAFAGECGQCRHLEHADVPAGDIRMRCGFSGEGLTATDAGQVCVSFRFSDAATADTGT